MTNRKSRVAGESELGPEDRERRVKEGWSLRVQTPKDIGCDPGCGGEALGASELPPEQGRSGCCALQGDKTEICRAIERLS